MVDSYSVGANKIPSSQLTSNISCLSNELLVEILCRLGSSKYAVRCKCISKRWFSILNTNSSSDSYFLRRWRKIHQKVTEEGDELSIVLLTQYRDFIDRTPQVIDYPSLFNKELPMFKSLLNTELPFDSVYVLATFKDLVLWCPSKIDHSVYCICNPFTRQWAVLPRPPRRSKADTIRVFLLVFDNDNDLKLKVVRIVARPDYSMKVEIFSSDDSSGKWREIQMGGPKYCFFLPPVSYNGILFWLGDSSEGKQVIGFKLYPHIDLANVDYTRLPFPLGFQVGVLSSSHMGVCGGCLRIAQLVCASRDGDDDDQNEGAYSITHKLTMWELDINSHNQVWELLVDELDLSRVLEDQYSSSARICRAFGFILAFHLHDRDILYLVFGDLTYPSKSYICLCNSRIKTVEVIREVSGSGCESFPLELPSWPTSIPLLPRPGRKSLAF